MPQRFALTVLLCLTLSFILNTFAEEKAVSAKKKIVLVAGKDSHKQGEHEFRAGCILLAKALNENVPGVETVCTFEGWPADNKIFDDAAAVVIYCDGGKGHPVRQQLEFVDGLVKKGIGVACMHYACEIPKGADGGDAFLKWMGGYYEDGYSINPHWVAQAILNKEHAITRGTSAFAVKDEWYYNIRFPEDKKGWTRILDAIPDDEARSGSTSWPRGPKEHIQKDKGRVETLLWCLERPDGGRGFGFTGGHYHINWQNDEFRKLILNAVVWLAKIEVPQDGVKSKTPSTDEMKLNLKPAK
mgnify:CR=1 FL=1